MKMTNRVLLVAVSAIALSSCATFKGKKKTPVLGNRIAILKDGQLIQVGTPREILHSPADDYVNRFVQRRSATV
ncbi:MAG: hypothetical protein EOP67_11420 [Sphingomonas sp.]|nr:MAG: hypothetical protein EOP67_11420 [Sphingomonas sp.]